MGYYIKSLATKKTEPRWKLQFVSHRAQHTELSRAKKPKKEWDVPRERWAALGINPHMRLADAKARVRQINAQLRLKLLEERQVELELRQKQLAQQGEAFFPEPFKAEFEQRFVFGRETQESSRDRVRTQRYAHWCAAQRVILKTRIDPSEWVEQVHCIYDYFSEMRLSMSYTQKILRMMNLWGYFICRKVGKPFMQLPYPRGFEKRRLQEAYFEKATRFSRESAPLTPGQLQAVKSDLTTANYNWLYLSVWLGLRPLEIDQLKNEQFVKFHKSPDGLVVIWVFQSKLTSKPTWQRWKLIPLIFVEQKTCIDIINAKNFSRPLVKTVRRCFGTDTSLYGGRKGFTDLMLSRNQDLVDVSQWMGHSTIERTWRHYKNRLTVHFRSAV